MKPNSLRAALNNPSSAALGGLVMLEGGQTAEVMARSGYDFLMVDVQHSSFMGREFVDVVNATRGTDTALIARVSPQRPDQIEWVLDSGASGVMVPLVNSVEDAQMAVDACRYPPRGRRSVGGVRQALMHGASYSDHADDDVVCIIQIEHTDGLDNLEEILQVPGIDAVTPGHVDLARSMGHIADYSRGISVASMPDEVRQAMATIEATCERYGVPVLPVLGTLDEVRVAADRGQRRLFFSSDYHQLRQVVGENLTMCRDLLG